ncbi:unnamed protein product [Closterium sp. Naga37s-1]|nr:unnamed protein product [Closterium sp. Naga37s-1]
MIVDDDEDDEEDDNEDDADFDVGKDSGSQDADEEDEDESDEEEEEEEKPAGKRKRGKAAPTAKKATPSKVQPAPAAVAKDSGGRGMGGGGGGRGGGEAGGGRGGGGGRGRGWGGRGGFFGERSAPPHKGEKEVPEGPENALTGITFVISGTLDSLEREEAEDLIKRHGGRITSAVSGKTTYLLADEDIGGRKSTKAKELGVKFLTEDGLFDLIRAAAKKQPPAPAKSPPAKQPLGADKGRPAADDIKPDADRLPKKLKADVLSSAGALAGKADAGAARPVVVPAAAARSGPVEVESWPQKYAPKSTADIIANQGLVKQLHDWLTGWEARHLGQGGAKKGKKGGKGGAGGGGGAAGGDMNKKAVLLSGGPGIGKTTTARLVCAALGFSPLEVNASDSRGKSDAKIRNGMGGATSNTIKEMISNTTLRFSPVPTSTKGKQQQQQQVDKAALIMDEVDGMSGGDRGGVADLIASIKESRVPIICICNDRYSQKLKSLINHCLLLNYRKPTRQQMAKRLRQVANAEKIQIADNALEELAERTGGDMRLALNQLQYMALSCRQLSYQEVKQRMQANAKDEDIRPMAAADTLMGYGARGKRLDILVDAAMSDIDLMPLFIQENYLNHVPGNDPSSPHLLARLSQAADAISSGDLVNVQVRRYQQWQHLQFAAVISCITPGLMVSGRRVTLLEGERNFNRFPVWLGKNSSVGKNYRLLDDLHQHLLSSHLLPNPSRQVVRLDYLEPLVSSLTQPLHKHAQDGVETVVEEMLEYGLTLDDLDTAVELSHFKGRSGPMEGVPAPVKARLTREFKKEQQAHKAKSAATLPPLQLPGGRGKAGGRSKAAKPSGGGGVDEASLLQADTDLPVAVDEVGTLQEDDDDAAEDASSEHDEADEGTCNRTVSSKEKPTLGGTRIKTRKRNIAVPLDPTSFADAIVHIYKDHQGDLELIAKDIDSSELDFSRYGETFFEVVLSGGRMQPGTTKPEEGAERQPWNVLSSPPTKEGVLKHVLFIQKILRRRPFMIKSLENVLRRWVQSLEMYEPEERKRLAVLTALCFSQRFTGLAPDVIFIALLNDTLVTKGTSLGFITDFFHVYLVETNMDDLVGLLKKGKVDQRLIEFMPSQKRTPDAFSQHFSNEGLKALADYQKKVVFDVKLKELHTALADMIEEEHTDVGDVIDMVKQRKKEGGLADGDVVRTVWDAVMGAVQWSGKNVQQNSNTALRQLKSWAKLLEAVCSSAKMELELLYHIQLQCYEDAKIQRLFPEFVRTLYDCDVLAEDTIMLWFRKGSNPKGRQLFVKALEPFIKWLEEADEED